MMNEPKEQNDDEAMLDHCAMECMTAIENKDKDGFKAALEVLLGDMLHKLSTPSED